MPASTKNSNLSCLAPKWCSQTQGYASACSPLEVRGSSDINSINSHLKRERKREREKHREVKWVAKCHTANYPIGKQTIMFYRL